MLDTRLTLALDGGGLVLPERGQIAVIKPSTEAQLDVLGRDRVVVIEGFKPASDLWARRGFETVVSADEQYAAAVVCLPRSKSDARALIARAMEVTQGPVVVDGQKTDGVDSVLKDMRKRVPLSAPISKAHGKLFWCDKADVAAFEDWRAGPAMTPGGFWTAPGVFSADGIDPASSILAAALPEDLGRQVADLGAGWGFLSAHVLTRESVEAVHLVEADYMALECAKRNVGDPRAVFHWADATAWQSPVPMDAVVMNPPFHVSRQADPSLGRAFIEAASRLLQPRGQLWMVANRHLPYEEALKSRFGNVIEIAGDARFKLFHAQRPLKKR